MGIIITHLSLSNHFRFKVTNSDLSRPACRWFADERRALGQGLRNCSPLWLEGMSEGLDNVPSPPHLLTMWASWETYYLRYTWLRNWPDIRTTNQEYLPLYVIFYWLTNQNKEGIFLLLTLLTFHLLWK